MKITIDTKEDSHHEIRKVVAMLNSMLEASGEIPEESSGSAEPIIGEGIFGMFSSNNEQEAPAAQAEETQSSEVDGLFSETKEEDAELEDSKVVEKLDDDDEDTRIVPY